MMLSKEQKLEKARIKIQQISEFLLDYLPLANVHNSDFIAQKFWKSHVSHNIAIDLLSLSPEQLAQLPSGKLYEKEVKEACNRADCKQPTVQYTKEQLANRLTVCTTCQHTKPNWDHTLRPKWGVNTLKDFVVKAQQNSLPYLDVLTDLHCLYKELGISQTSDVFIGNFMSTKKSYEVHTMAKSCKGLASHYNINKVIDIGSGKGYLGCQLSLMYGLHVLGIDSSTTNTHGAKTRAVRLQKHWNGLIRNAKEDIQLGYKKKRGKNYRGRLRKKESSISKENTDVDTPETPDVQDSLDLDDVDLESIFKITETEPVISYNNTPGPLATSSTTISMCRGRQNQEKRDSSCQTDISMFRNPKVAGISHVGCANLDDLTNLCGNGSSCNTDTNSRAALNDSINSCVKPKKNMVHHREHASPEVIDRRMLEEEEKRENDKEDMSIGSDQKVQREQSIKEESKLYMPVTHYVTNDTDLLELVKCHLPSAVKEGETFMLTGLHTCGNLAASMLHLFVANHAVEVICNVGCCYHLLEEEFLRNPYLEDGELDYEEVGFPLSDYLRHQGVQLGRNARMLASQAPDRAAEEYKLPGETIFWRALLQQILQDVTGEIRDDWHVGKIAGRSNNFVQYVVKAFHKLHIPENQRLTEKAIVTYEKRYADQSRKIKAFVQLRAVLAPCIEALLMLDRLCYLLEREEVLDAHLVQMFEPVKSPRCYGIIAVKRYKDNPRHHRETVV